LKLNWQTTFDCVEASFSSKTNREKISVKNSIIEKEIALWLDIGAQIYPSVVINKKTYRGQIEPLAVFNALCAGFKEPPQQCLKTLHREPASSIKAAIEANTTSDNATIAEIVIIAVFIVLLNVLVVYCCRRRARRDL